MFCVLVDHISSLVLHHELVNCHPSVLPLSILQASKRHPFWAEPPCMAHSREYLHPMAKCGLFKMAAISSEFALNFAGKSKLRSRKRKLLKVDQLLLPESTIKPVGSKKRKIAAKKNKQAESPSDLSSSDEEEERSRPLEDKDNKNETTKLFDLWETKGKAC